MSITYRLLKSMLQCRSKVAYNVIGLGEGGLVGGSNLANVSAHFLYTLLPAGAVYLAGF
jgi:hypothetical protein